jgi:hypothetical protein
VPVAIGLVITDQALLGEVADLAAGEPGGDDLSEEPAEPGGDDLSEEPAEPGGDDLSEILGTPHSRAPDPVGALPPATPPDSPRIDVIWLNGHAA